ncbi:MAG TPA: serine/threonine-protein kinase [Polyangiaceae bacterium]|nr:serine/threonine-protein kinase [Polyangiaceae bacterium]
MTPGLPAPGSKLAGKYELVRVIGKGGMGVVMEARDVRLGRRVAVKMLRPQVSAARSLVARFEREARAAAQLQNPHVVRLLDVGVTAQGLPFMVMEYLEGHGLDVELAARGPLPVGEAVAYVLQACEGLAEAHAHGIVHRDIKPANLFLCNEGGRRTVKVLDFGISKLRDGRASAVTQTGLGLGTLEYISPEQLRSARSADERADIWSLGVVLFELLAGTTPFRARTAAETLQAIDARAPRPLRGRCPEAPPGLEAAVARALNKRPSRRFASIAQLVQALAPFALAEAAASGAVTVFTAPRTVPAVLERRGGGMSPALPQRSWGRADLAMIAFGLLGVVASVALFTLGAMPARRGEAGVDLASGAGAPVEATHPAGAHDLAADPAPRAPEPVAPAPAPPPPEGPGARRAADHAAPRPKASAAPAKGASKRAGHAPGASAAPNRAAPRDVSPLRP